MVPIEQEINIKASVADIMRALTTPSEIAAWHSSDARASDGSVMMGGTTAPLFRWRLETNGTNEALWSCLEGPGSAKGSIARFALRPLDDGRVLLTLTHTNPRGHADLCGCNARWGALLYHLKHYAESAKPAPAFG
jgi:hypothetical protein